MDTGCSRVSRPNWFIGLPLPRQADWHQASLTAPPELRRFHPADLHLTVAFLGPCGVARAEAAWLALAPHASAATTVSAGSWRALGPARQPSAYGLLLDQGRVELEQLLARWGAFALEAAAQTTGVGAMDAADAGVDGNGAASSPTATAGSSGALHLVA